MVQIVQIDLHGRQGPTCLSNTRHIDGLMQKRSNSSGLAIARELHFFCITMFTKIIGHVGHFWWLCPNVWWEISQNWIEYIKPFGQMSDEPWKFFCYTALSHWYHGCCWPGDPRSQGIICNGIELVFLKYSFFSSRRVMCVFSNTLIAFTFPLKLSSADCHGTLGSVTN